MVTSSLPGIETMGTLVRLKDLATRAGRRLGLATPPTRHTAAVAADRLTR